MKKENKKFLKQIVLALVIIILSLVFFFGIVLYKVTKLFNPPVEIYTAESISDLDSSDYDWKNILDMAGVPRKLPKSAKNIFLCDDNLRDPAFWISFEISPHEIDAFLSELGIKSLYLKDGITSEYSSINDGPRDLKKGKVDNEYWNLSEVKNGKHYERVDFYLGIDFNTNRIYICRSSS